MRMYAASRALQVGKKYDAHKLTCTVQCYCLFSQIQYIISYAWDTYLQHASGAKRCVRGNLVIKCCPSEDHGYVAEPLRFVHPLLSGLVPAMDPWRKANKLCRILEPDLCGGEQSRNTKLVTPKYICSTNIVI